MRLQTQCTVKTCNIYIYIIALVFYGSAAPTPRVVLFIRTSSRAKGDPSCVRPRTLLVILVRNFCADRPVLRRSASLPAATYRTRSFDHRSGPVLNIIWRRRRGTITRAQRRLQEFHRRGAWQNQIPTIALKKSSCHIISVTHELEQ